MEIDTQTHHPNPQPDPHHRKIELQSPLDLSYLQQNLAKSALAKLDLHFPPIPTASKPATVISLDGSSQSLKPARNPEEPQTNNTTTEIEIEPDPLRTKVQSLLSSFLQQTWSNAQLNLSVNNLDASTHPIPSSAILKPSPSSPSSASSSPNKQTNSEATQPVETEGVTFQYTPYSPHLQTKLSSLYNELEKLTGEVSQLRRVAPHQGAERHIASLTTTLESEDASHDSALQSITDEEETVVNLTTMQMRRGWNEDTKEIYQLAIEKLDSLAGMSGTNNTVTTTQDTIEDAHAVNGNGKRKREPSLTETMGKVQRARTVALEME